MTKIIIDIRVLSVNYIMIIINVIIFTKISKDRMACLVNAIIFLLLSNKAFIVGIQHCNHTVQKHITKYYRFDLSNMLLRYISCVLASEKNDPYFFTSLTIQLSVESTIARLTFLG
jgi:hypothetical protein